MQSGREDHERPHAHAGQQCTERRRVFVQLRRVEGRGRVELRGVGRRAAVDGGSRPWATSWIAPMPSSFSATPWGTSSI